jgi:hypothetical protein
MPYWLWFLTRAVRTQSLLRAADFLLIRTCLRIAQDLTQVLKRFRVLLVVGVDRDAKEPIIGLFAPSALFCCDDGRRCSSIKQPTGMSAL